MNSQTVLFAQFSWQIYLTDDTSVICVCVCNQERDRDRKTEENEKGKCKGREGVS